MTAIIQGMRIVYQDSHFIAIHKPAYLLSVPGRHAYKYDSVTHRLQKEFPFAREVHRLDWETSGLMLVGLTKDAHRHLSMQFQNRQTAKQYIALVYGAIEQTEEFLIDLPLCLDWDNRPIHHVDHEQGKPSQTLVQVDTLSDDGMGNPYTRVILKPITGRSHQLRVHMQAIGHAILGDSLYAPVPLYQTAARLMLHAQDLHFFHPESGEPMHLQAPCPF